MPIKMFTIPRDSTAFGEYYDHIQDGLKTLAGMDELMAGKYTTSVVNIVGVGNISIVS